ncbi:hypothetical protein CERZMDRAFT_115779 [Cercospora zeae-maydis SCOH1-5]|uniref:Major facilitator superfamily (MFS) profile domain-containing protein n=1 Tax=Cercospora zeae-maydis SCOH1-5 TaxID=717836 RepID=A0A6A6EYS6_9PEZI|nr:hypothetical protein CERZMDRAFT_115779 [Cercospora zeae-maydis SCOH1-5]
MEVTQNLSTTPCVELSSRPATSRNSSANVTLSPNQIQSALPPTDSGRGAWTALFGAFVINATIWGFALSFGVLQEFYTSHEPFSSKPAGIAAIGTTCTGIMYLTMPIFLVAFQRWPRARQYSLWTSLPVVAVALVGASFAETVPQLMVTQGIVYAFAGNALVMPTINYINEWFVRRKGLAIGISIAGDGVGGVVMPLLLQALLSAVGFRWTLRIIALIICSLSLPLIFILKPRLPISATHIAPPVQTTFLRHRLFWALQLFNGIQALGYFLPMNYLPTIAEEFGVNRTLGSLTVVLINMGAVIGCIVVGALVDRFNTMTVMLAVSALAGSSVLIVLGFTIAVPPLFIFSVVYGLTASAYSSHWGGLIREVQKKHDGTDANLIFGLLAAGRGVGSIISGPLSESLLMGSRVWEDGAVSAYSSEYGTIIIFSGCTALLGGGSWFMRKAGII